MGEMLGLEVHKQHHRPPYNLVLAQRAFPPCLFVPDLFDVSHGACHVLGIREHTNSSNPYLREKLRHRELKQPVQGHTAKSVKDWDSLSRPRP